MEGDFGVADTSKSTVLAVLTFGLIGPSLPSFAVNLML